MKYMRKHLSQHNFIPLQEFDIYSYKCKHKIKKTKHSTPIVSGTNALKCFQFITPVARLSQKSNVCSAGVLACEIKLSQVK